MLYTKEEEQALRDNYKIQTVTQLQKTLKSINGVARGRAALCSKLRKMGYSKPKPGFYTEEQTAYLRYFMKKNSSFDLTAKFNEKYGQNRTFIAIKCKVNQLKALEVNHPPLKYADIMKRRDSAYDEKKKTIPIEETGVISRSDLIMAMAMADESDIRLAAKINATANEVRDMMLITGVPEVYAPRVKSVLGL